jgi:hypothetical protein
MANAFACRRLRRLRRLVAGVAIGSPESRHPVLKTLRETHSSGHAQIFFTVSRRGPHRGLPARKGLRTLGFKAILAETMPPSDPAPQHSFVTVRPVGLRLGKPYAMGKRDMLFKAGLLDRMRRAAQGLLLGGALAMLASSSAFAASTVTLVWDPSPGGNIAGYRIYYGPSSRAYTNTLAVGNATTATLSNLVTGATYYFAATAYDTANLESDYSAEVGYTNVALAPPIIVLTSPTGGALFTAPATIGLAASVTANGHAITKVQFYSGATLLAENTNTPYAFPWTGVSAGTYSLTARLVYDAGATLDSTPAVNVLVAAARPPNTPPTISAIADQSTPQDTPTLPIPFTIGDAETAASNLTVYAASTNPALVSTNNIVFGGSDSNLTVTLTPVAGATGTVAITVYVSDEGGLTTNTTFQLAVTASMTPSRQANGALSPAAGTQSTTASSTYSGLFHQDDAVRLASAGSFTLTVTPRGKYSGRIQIGTKHYSFSGLLDPQQEGGTNVIKRHDGPSFTLDFHLGAGAQASQVTGHLTDGTWTSTLAGDRAVFGKGITPAFAGNYTLVIPGYDANPSLPAGDGFGMLKVNSAGRVKFVGTLADGTKVSQSAPVSGTGLWPLYLPLYSGNGSLMSWLAFASSPTNDLSGRLIWLKQAGSKSKYYLGGFACECDAFGSTYLRTDPILNLPAASLTFCGGGLASDITNSITIGPRNKVGTPGKQLNLSFSASTGTFKGRFLDPATGKPLSFSGAVFQKLNAAYGVLFGTGDQTSEISLTPQ